MDGFLVPSLEVGLIAELPNGRPACCSVVSVPVVQALLRQRFAAFLKSLSTDFVDITANLWFSLSESNNAVENIRLYEA